MSVTFSPVVDRKNLKEEKLNWTADYVQHCNWDNLPDQWKKLSRKSYIGGDIGYFLWKEGIKPLPVWQKWVQKFGMILSEDYPFRKVYIDNIDYKVAIILHGEPPENAGMEMQLANSNASTLCQILGIDSAGGSMRPLELLRRVERAKSKNLSDFTRENTDEKHIDPEAPMGLGNGPRIISFGLDEQRLETLCDHCIQQECDISWG